MPGIVVGVDGSGHSQRALEWAAREAALRKAPLIVLHVHRVLAGWTGQPVPYPGDLPAAEHEQETARIETEKVMEQLGDARPRDVTVRVITGMPAEDLIRASAGAEMIVVGSRGAGGFSRLLLGSVSGQVAHHAHCPVVVIPAENRE